MRWGLPVLLIATGCGTVLAASETGSSSETDNGADAAPAASNDGGGTLEDASDGSTSVGDGPPTACPGAIACERVVFMTSTQFEPDELGSVEGADVECNTAAMNATSPRVMGRKFRAWISAGTVSPSSRLVHGSKPYVRPTGEVIAQDWNQLASATHLATMDQDENGNTFVQTALVWTGTTESGSSTGADCNGWTTKDDLVKATKGDPLKTSEKWSNDDADKCDQNHRIYCVEE